MYWGETQIRLGETTTPSQNDAWIPTSKEEVSRGAWGVFAYARARAGARAYARVCAGVRVRPGARARRGADIMAWERQCVGDLRMFCWVDNVQY